MAAVRVMDERHDLKRVVDPAAELQTGPAAEADQVR